MEYRILTTVQETYESFVEADSAEEARDIYWDENPDRDSVEETDEEIISVEPFVRQHRRYNSADKLMED